MISLAGAERFGSIMPAELPGAQPPVPGRAGAPLPEGKGGSAREQ